MGSIPTLSANFYIMDIIEQKIENLTKEIELLNHERDKLIFDKVSQTYTNSYWKCTDSDYFKITEVKKVFILDKFFTCNGYYLSICNSEYHLIKIKILNLVGIKIILIGLSLLKKKLKKHCSISLKI